MRDFDMAVNSRHQDLELARHMRQSSALLEVEKSHREPASESPSLLDHLVERIRRAVQSPPVREVLEH